MEPLISSITRKARKFLFNIFYSRRFGYFGKGVSIHSPLHIYGEENISVGDNTLIQYKSWLAAVPHTGASRCELKIGKGCVIGHFNEIYATESIVIEDKVLTADRVYISDNLHTYENPDIPVMDQPVKQIGTVRIGEGSWLGVGVVVLGANIGKHCVIGANSVVTKDIPDYCVAVGVPARVIRRFNHSTCKWEASDDRNLL